jgi:hypothetical protein
MDVQQKAALSEYANALKASPRTISYGLAALLSLAYVAAFYTGFRMPSLWTINYYIPGFFDGIFRRGLLGTLLYPLGDLRFSYYLIVGIQFAVLAALNVVIITHVFKANIGVRAAYILFLLAPTGAYLFHEVGYIDQLLYLMLFLVLVLRNVVIVSVLLALSIFVHELAVFTIIPIYMAHKIITREKLTRLALPAAACAAAFLMVYFFLQTADSAVTDAFLQKLAEKAEYKVRVDYYNIHENTFTGSRAQLYYQKHLILEFCLVVALGAVIAFARSQPATTIRRKLLLFGAGMAACTSPLLLGFLGWDTSRWIFLAFCSSFVMLYLWRASLRPPHYAAVGVIMALFLTFGDLRYFNKYTPRSSDFQSIADFVGGGFLRQIRTRPSQ